MPAHNPTPDQARDILNQLGDTGETTATQQLTPAAAGQTSRRAVIALSAAWGLAGALATITPKHTVWLLGIIVVAAIAVATYAGIAARKGPTRPNSRTPLGQEPPLPPGIGRATVGNIVNYLILTMGGQALRDTLPANMLIPGACGLGLLLAGITYWALKPTIATTPPRRK